jgi:putative exosortase-associated protein (TIGR04073 family)
MVLRIVAVAVVAVLIAVPAYSDGPVKKLGRGLSNAITFPLEIPANIKKVNESDGFILAATYGLGLGIYKAVARAAIGFYETATFPFPFPGDFAPIVTDPEFFFDSSQL